MVVTLKWYFVKPGRYETLWNISDGSRPIGRKVNSRSKEFTCILRAPWVERTRKQFVERVIVSAAPSVSCSSRQVINEAPVKAERKAVVARLAYRRVAGKDASKLRKLSRGLGRSLKYRITGHYSSYGRKSPECSSRRKREQRRNDHRGIGNSSGVSLNLNKQVLTLGMQITNL